MRMSVTFWILTVLSVGGKITVTFKCLWASYSFTVQQLVPDLSFVIGKLEKCKSLGNDQSLLHLIHG